MDKFWKEIALAAVMGMVLPWALLLAGAAGREKIPAQTEASQQVQVQTAPSVPKEITETVRTYLPVRTQEDRILLMELEQYLSGVVLAEMPAYFDMEALMAQAVVARTYTLRRLQTHSRHAGAAVCADPTCCQAYISEMDYLEAGGSREAVDRIRQAVRETEGLILTYDNEPIEATYFSCSGGKTESAAAVWGEEIPYLQSVDSPGEESAETFRSSVYFSEEEFSEALGRNLTGPVADWLGKVVYTDGGGVARMSIGGMSYTGTELRELLGLNSTAFQMTAGRYGIAVETKGKGHRVGMSQYGADAMAERGCTWEQILLFYYQGAVIDKVQNIG